MPPSAPVTGVALRRGAPCDTVLVRRGGKWMPALEASPGSDVVSVWESSAEVDGHLYASDGDDQA